MKSPRQTEEKTITETRLAVGFIYHPTTKRHAAWELLVIPRAFTKGIGRTPVVRPPTMVPNRALTVLMGLL
jgi:hypothetical protein